MKPSLEDVIFKCYMIHSFGDAVNSMNIQRGLNDLESWICRIGVALKLDTNYNVHICMSTY